MKDVVRFSVGQRQDDTIHRLEWLIVILLAIELVLTAGELGAKMVEAETARSGPSETPSDRREARSMFRAI